MLIAKNIACLILFCQGTCLILLLIATALDGETFHKIGLKRHFAVPGLIKAAKLFRASDRPMMQALYFFCIVFVLFSYAAVVLLIAYIISLMI